MKNLSKRYVTILEAQKNGFELTGFNERDLKEKMENLKEFSSFGELIPCVTFNYYDSKTHFEHVNVMLNFNGTLLQPSRPYNKKMFRFYIVDSFDIKDYSNKNVEPNQVGKPTEKKLNDWLTFLLAEEVEKKEIQATRDSVESDFIKKLETSGQKVRWSQNKKSGWIENDLIEYSFEICNGYISEKITPRKRDLNSFLTLIK